ncbi:two-component system chemotaxis sensor kinase CheA [Paenibacillus anaericanus]|uniref:response regulator n=1 Tax=Paenibacillus anaericanus TaxID=170367 RepID=UPI0027899EAC|nr:response regulator [Paenibacillus anaericanus]MDQ0089024.1 two-component system chemotaxis sensor kinase CheA [Paenibacillus anaericanus]
MLKIKWNLQMKILAGYLIVIIFLIASIGMIHYRISAMQAEIKMITQHDRNISDLTNKLEAHVINMETGQRGFVITGNNIYLEPYTQARLNWEDTYNSLLDEVADNPEQIQNLKSIHNHIVKWINTDGEPIIELKRSNQEQMIEESFNENVGIKQIDNIRAQVGSFRDIENELSSTRISTQNHNNKMLVIYLYVVGFLLTVLSLISAYVTSKTIVRAIKDITTAIQEIAISGGGNSGRRIQIKTQDEIGELGKATNVLLEEHQQQSILMNQVGDMSTMYHEIKDSVELSERFLAKLTTIIEFQYGAIYIQSEQHNSCMYIKTASYAGESGSIGKNCFLLGEGLVGQSAKDKKIIELVTVPPDYVKIDSALGETSPHSIYIMPIEFQGITLAVLEIASLHKFTTKDKMILKEIAEPFGAVVQSVLSHMEIQKLFIESRHLNEELQVHAEELETQSEELRSVNNQLEEQNHYILMKSIEVENARVEMEQYARQARSNSNYKSQFLATMSHELRTPLNSMLLFSQFLEENNNGTLTEEELGYAKYIHSSGLDLLNLINDILDLSKVEAGMMNVVLEPVNITELPQIMNQHFGSLAEKKQLEFNIVIEPDLPNLIVTDESRLQQILKNLISNAIKFTNKGSVEFRIQKSVNDKSVCKADSNLPQETICFIVKDTGIGIAAAHLERIFEAFHQADGTIEREYGGTGLGLSISRQLVKLLGGNIYVDSKENEGSTFTVMLPINNSKLDLLFDVDLDMAAAAKEEVTSEVEEESIQPLSYESEVNSPLFKGKRVLIVDDDERNLLALTPPLKSKGMDVITAQTGQQAIDLIHKQDFDIVLMDIMMPGMNGLEAIKIIRNVRTELPIISVTAKAMIQDRMDSLEAGASDFISKPLNLEQLFTIMRVWLSKS